MMYILFFLHFIQGIEYSTSTDKRTLYIKGAGVTSREEILKICVASNIIKIDLDDVTEIGPQSFYGFSLLTEVKFCDTLTKLSSEAFKECSSLQTLVISDNVMTIESYCMEFCKKIETIQFPKKLKSINYNCIDRCYALKTIILNNGDNFHSNSSNTLLIYNTEVVLCAFNQKTIIIPSYVTKLRSGLMYLHTSVSYIKFEKGSMLEETGADCFVQSGLINISFPSGLKIIGNDPFRKSYDLEYVYIPASLESFSNLFSVVPKTVVVEKGCKCLNVDEDNIIMDKKNKTVVLIPSDAKRLVLKATIEKIDGGLLRGAKLMTSFEVEEGNNNYASWKNLLYTKYCKTLIGCPGGVKAAQIADNCTACQKWAFANTNIEDVAFGANLHTVGYAMFEKCKQLVKVTINQKIREISEYAFISSSLKDASFVFPETLQTLSGSSFYGTGIVSADFSKCKSLTRIETNAFYNCKSLKSVVFSDSIQYISGSSFYSCSSLESVSLPGDLIEIGSAAFKGCKLSTVEFAGSKVTTIMDSAFEGCQFKNIQIPDSVTTISQKAFGSCPNLMELVFGEESLLKTFGMGILMESHSVVRVRFGKNLKEYPSGALSKMNDFINFEVSENNKNYTASEGVLYNKDKTILVAFPCGRTSCDISGKVEAIGDSAFFECQKLVNVTFDEDVPLYRIGSYTFYQCISLKEIQIPKNTKNISSSAFEGCESLKVVDLSDENLIEEIEEGTFAGCIELAYFNIGKNSKLRKISKRAFSGCVKLRVFSFIEGIEEIGESSFEGCGFSLVQLPYTVSVLSKDSFRSCKELSRVEFCWKKGVSKISLFSESAFTETQINCLYVTMDFIETNMDTLCGKIVIPSLDSDCKTGSVQFTPGYLPAIKFDLMALVLTEDECN